MSELYHHTLSKVNDLYQRMVYLRDKGKIISCYELYIQMINDHIERTQGIFNQMVSEMENKNVPRKQINQQHPAIVSGGYRLLQDNERLECGDETVCINQLLSIEGAKWEPVSLHRYDYSAYIADIVSNLTEDKDQRIFRRRTW